MPSIAEQLDSIETNTLAELVTLSATRQRNYSIDGVAIDYDAEERKLKERLAWVREQRASTDAGTFVVSQLQ